MGADMIISWIYHHKSNTPENVKAEMLNIVDSLTDDELKEYYNNANLDYIDRDTAIINHKTLITQAWECIESRHVTYGRFKGWVLYLTGGDSWGDSPTDESDLFNQIAFMNNRVWAVMDKEVL